MRVLIDTNVLISAALSANGTPFQAYVKAASYPNHGLICEQNVDEMKRIFNKKFPNRLAALDKFLSVALLTLKLVPVPTDENVSETQIRDVNDRPILREAIEAKADVLLTGDKDFLESGVKNPAIMTPAEFFAPLDDANTPYRELCEKLRTMNEEDLEKVSIFIGWIEKKE